MSLSAEHRLIGLLPDLDSIETLAREGLPEDTIPTQALRPVVSWALDYYRSSTKAPTVEVMKDRFEDLLADNDIDLDTEVDESIEWVMDTLRASYVRNQAGTFSRRMVTEITQCAPEERVEVFARYASEMSAMALDLIPQTSRVDMRGSADRILTNYDAAVANQGQVRGLAFGLDQVDTYTGGIHDGEICVVAAGPKTGKSWFLDRVALKEWERGRVAALFTLENSIEMTEMRIACMATGVSVMEMQAGTLSDEDYQTLVEWINDVLRASDTPLHIFNPPVVQRTPHGIVQAGMACEAESLIVDQLTFVESARNVRDQSRTYELRDIMHDFKGLISTGRYQVPLLLAHQIKREGLKAAERTGELQMDGMADSSEVERSADWAFGLYAGTEERRIHRMQLQGLASRRAPLQSFDLNWHIEVGMVGVVNNVSFEGVL